MNRGAILVVEDNEVHRTTLVTRLEREGHRVTSAENGVKALDLMRSQPFDVVLLDILMPEMDGYQVLKHIKADPTLQQLQLERHGHQALLRAVVQVALEAAALRVAGCHDALARRPELREPGA